MNRKFWTVFDFHINFMLPESVDDTVEDVIHRMTLVAMIQKRCLVSKYRSANAALQQAGFHVLYLMLLELPRGFERELALGAVVKFADVPLLVQFQLALVLAAHRTEATKVTGHM